MKNRIPIFALVLLFSFSVVGDENSTITIKTMGCDDEQIVNYIMTRDEAFNIPYCRDYIRAAENGRTYSDGNVIDLHESISSETFEKLLAILSENIDVIEKDEQALRYLHQKLNTIPQDELKDEISTLIAVADFLRINEIYQTLQPRLIKYLTKSARRIFDRK